jgi:tRNA(Ile2) C34 agmatinyltransferase TiaS
VLLAEMRKAYQVIQYRTNNPEKSCARCGTILRSAGPTGIYCSRRCSTKMAQKAFYARKRAERERSNVIYLTPEIFDGWFKMAA